MRTANRLLVLFLLLFCFSHSYGQIRVVDDGSAGLGTMQPQTSAKFHIVVDRTNNPQGFLMPIMFLTERNSIPNPADGLMVYVEDMDAAVRGPYYYKKDPSGSGEWIKMDGTVVNWTDINGVPDDIADGDNQILLPGSVDPSTEELILEIENGNEISIDLSPLFGDYWSLNGNNITSGVVLGSKNGLDLKLITSDEERVIVDAEGRTIFRYNETDNVFLGEDSGASGLNGGRNIFIQTNNSTDYNNGQDNIGIGTHSGINIVGGDGNIAIGQQAGGNITNGFSNIHLGSFSGAGSSGYDSDNTFIGSFSGGNSSGGNNVFLGSQSGSSSVNGYNVAIGAKAGMGSGVSDGSKLHIHSSNAEVGDESLIYGDFANEFIDVNGNLRVRDVDAISTLDANDKILLQETNSDEVKYATVDDITGGMWSTSGNNNTTGAILGTMDGEPLNIYTGGNNRITIDTDGRIIPKESTSTNTIMIGKDAGSMVSTDVQDIFIQNNEGPLNGILGNIAVGSYSGQQLTSTSHNNVLIGNSTGKNLNGYNNIALGHQALGSSTSQWGIYLGSSSGSESSGLGNCVMGHVSGKNNSGGTNVILGYYSGTDNSGDDNVLIGRSTGRYISGSDNIFIGRGTGSDGSDNVAENSGSENVFIGNHSGNSNESGNDNVLIGSSADLTEANIDHAVVIGAEGMVSSSNHIKLHTNDSDAGVIEGDINWSVTSDRRFKKYVESDVPGLEMIMRLNPVSYKFDYLDYMTHLTQNLPDSVRQVKLAQYSNAKEESRNQTGFLAQEVEQVCHDIGYEFGGLFKDDPKITTSNYSLAYGVFVVPLVKAVQEQQAIIDDQNKELSSLVNSEGELQERLESLKKSSQTLQETADRNESTIRTFTEVVDDLKKRIDELERK